MKYFLFLHQQKSTNYVYEDRSKRREDDGQPKEGWIECEETYAIYMVLLKNISATPTTVPRHFFSINFRRIWIEKVVVFPDYHFRT